MILEDSHIGFSNRNFARSLSYFNNNTLQFHYDLTVRSSPTTKVMWQSITKLGSQGWISSSRHQNWVQCIKISLERQSHIPGHVAQPGIARIPTITKKWTIIYQNKANGKYKTFYTFVGVWIWLENVKIHREAFRLLKMVYLAMDSWELQHPTQSFGFVAEVIMS